MFEATCNSTPGVTESAWTDPALTIDLLTQSTNTIDAPTLSVIPANCFDTTTTWSTKLTADDTDVTSASTVYSMDETTGALTITTDPDNFETRRQLVGAQAMYYIGTVDTDPAYTTSKSDFSVTFTDACTTSTI